MCLISLALPSMRSGMRHRRNGALVSGVTGVADALIMLGVRYGTGQAVKLVGKWMQAIQNEAYRASSQLADLRGSFPMYNPHMHQHHLTNAGLDLAVCEAIAKNGLRNGVLTTIPPTGTTSMYGGNVSSGIEPVFAAEYRRLITRPDGSRVQEQVEDYAVYLYRQKFGKSAELNDAFVTVADLGPTEHIRMQAAAQRWVDSGISKTVNCPENIPFAVLRGRLPCKPMKLAAKAAQPTGPTRSPGRS